MSARLAFDYSLWSQAATLGDGAHVHRLSNLMFGYSLSFDCALHASEFIPVALQAEQDLRSFIYAVRMSKHFTPQGVNLSVW